MSIVPYFFSLHRGNKLYEAESVKDLVDEVVAKNMAAHSNTASMFQKIAFQVCQTEDKGNTRCRVRCQNAQFEVLRHNCIGTAAARTRSI